MYVRKSSESEDRQTLSIPAQQKELSELAHRLQLTVVGEPVTEAMSAKYPGRPKFAEVVDAIRKGKADGILCWHLNRLARNPIDGGTIMWELGQGTIKEIVTPGRTFTGTADEKFMMSIVFGEATKYSDDLSQVVKRGNRQALEAGRWISKPKLGFVRDPQTKALVPDPERYDHVQKMFRLRLSGTPVLDIVRIAREDWGFRTPKFGRVGGGPLSSSQMYRLFSDQFYAGAMLVGGQSYQGSHSPMITWAEYRKLQPTAPGPSSSISRAKHLFFPYRGLVTCGACGGMVTAEKKTHARTGRNYVYYHCWRKLRRYAYCPEPSIQEHELEEQIERFIASIQPSDEVVDWLTSKADSLMKEDQALQAEDRVRLSSLVEKCDARLRRLRQLCADGVISAEELAADRRQIQDERTTAVERIKAIEHGGSYLEKLPKSISFVNRAISSFRSGSPAEKRAIVQALTSNQVLTGGKLQCTAKNIFELYRNLRTIPSWLGDLESNQDTQLQRLLSYR